MKYTLQYASNFFLNLQKKNDFQRMLLPSSENLALLGNICSLDTEKSIDVYNEFLTYTSYNWKHIYIIPGPYEYSSVKPKYYNECLNELYKLKDLYSNIKILNNNHVNIPNTDIQVVGSTLWANYPYIRNQYLYEYNNIWLNSRNGLSQLLGTDIINWNDEDISYIKNTIKSSNRSIILTHHLPHPILNNDLSRIKLDSSDFESILCKPIEIWLSGAGNTTTNSYLGYSSDVFCATNPHTTYTSAKCNYNSSYLSKTSVSIRKNFVELV